jgi:hypothetical protein
VLPLLELNKKKDDATERNAVEEAYRVVKANNLRRSEEIATTATMATTATTTSSSSSSSSSNNTSTPLITLFTTFVTTAMLTNVSLPSVTGEASPDYLVSGPHAVANTLRFLPRTKIIVRREGGGGKKEVRTRGKIDEKHMQNIKCRVFKIYI